MSDAESIDWLQSAHAPLQIAAMKLLAIEHDNERDIASDVIVSSLIERPGYAAAWAASMGWNNPSARFVRMAVEACASAKDGRALQHLLKLFTTAISSSGG